MISCKRRSGVDEFNNCDGDVNANDDGDDNDGDNDDGDNVVGDNVDGDIVDGDHLPLQEH